MVRLRRFQLPVAVAISLIASLMLTAPSLAQDAPATRPASQPASQPTTQPAQETAVRRPPPVVTVEPTEQADPEPVVQGRVLNEFERDTYRWAFDWSPGILGVLLLFELVLLATMGGFRWVAKLLGRAEPNDPMVIFYRVFWRAMLQPKHYPVPVNYEPVLPREKRQMIPGSDQAGLNEDELERLFSDDDDEPIGRPKGSVFAYDEANAMVGGGTLLVRCEGPAPAEQVVGFDDETLVVRVTCEPDAGQANAAAMRAAAIVLGVEAYRVQITSGQIRASKELKINGMSDEAIEKKRLSLEGTGIGADDQSLTFRDD